MKQKHYRAAIKELFHGRSFKRNIFFVYITQTYRKSKTLRLKIAFCNRAFRGKFGLKSPGKCGALTRKNSKTTRNETLDQSIVAFIGGGDATNF
jgi:hypothetical protein